MNKHRKRLLTVLLSVFLFLSFCSIYLLLNKDWIGKFFDDNGQDPDENLSTVKNVSIVVDFGNSSVEKIENVTFQHEYLTAFTILDFYYHIEYDTYTNGNLVTGINGVSNNLQTNKFWYYYVNQEYISIAASNYVLQESDLILWNYTDYKNF